jgi:diadenylate cyclase
MLLKFLLSLQNLWEQLRFWDFIDLVFVWLIIYRVLLLIRHTRAVQVLSGLGILAITYIVSVSLDLSTLNWLLEKFFNNLFVIVVILFQNEIRKTLAHIGRNPFLINVSVGEETHVVEELVRGAVHLAQRRIGALIVIEREINLDDYIEVGTKIDSTISNELLQSIFVPQTPLHDGAVVLRGGRAYAAGCFLPLTKNPNVDKNLGTRHRAAIGITEETDAVVIVVSEEKSQISVVMGGKMIQDLDEDALRKSLYTVFQLDDAYEPEPST